MSIARIKTKARILKNGGTKSRMWVKLAKIMKSVKINKPIIYFRLKISRSQLARSQPFKRMNVKLLFPIVEAIFRLKKPTMMLRTFNLR